MTWKLLGQQDGWATVPPNSTVRYGDSVTGRFVDRVLSGTFPITNGTFGSDPVFGVKSAWLWEGQGQPPAAQPPAPPPPVAPTPPPVAPPSPDGLPALTDPDFDKKMVVLNYRQRIKEYEQGLREYDQRERTIALMQQVAAPPAQA
jgi:hypothetical protein